MLTTWLAELVILIMSGKRADETFYLERRSWSWLQAAMTNLDKTEEIKMESTMSTCQRSTGQTNQRFRRLGLQSKRSKPYCLWFQISAVNKNFEYFLGRFNIIYCWIKLITTNQAVLFNYSISFIWKLIKLWGPFQCSIVSFLSLGFTETMSDRPRSYQK